jgi:hypothetical protein
MIRMNSFFATTVFLMLGAWIPLFAAETNDVLLQIERMASLGEKAERSLGESIADGIESNRVQISRALVAKLNDKNLTEQQRAVYIWALGLSRDANAMDVIISLHRANKSDLVRGNCLHALATIGGKQAGEFLLSILNTTTDKEKRFDILNLLGQMQYEAAMPKAEEVLKQDPKEFYWQSIFVFGKMGDKALPFLLERINNKDRNIRANAINVVGQWLISPEAAKPMQDQFWTERDAELRGMILSSLERTIPDFAQMKTVFEQVVAKEKDRETLKFAHETLGKMDQMRADVTAFAQKKQSSATSFEGEYKQLFRSAGKKGSYEVLGVSSTVQDELKLKVLRERILQRDSDEAFYDYQKVNDIMIRNRLAHSLKNKRTSNKPDASDGKQPRLIRPFDQRKK